MSQKAKNSFYHFNKEDLSFRSQEALKHRTVYFPLGGIEATGLKSAITPQLAGDIKVDKFRYVTKPVSTEDLCRDLRQIFIKKTDDQDWLAVHRVALAHDGYMEAGPLWHRLHCPDCWDEIDVEVTSYVPVNGDSLELMEVSFKNKMSQTVTLDVVSAIPLFGRGVANKHDHEHVTSLLNRIESLPQGLVMQPTMQFDEEGHLPNDNAYFVAGLTDQGVYPDGIKPTVNDFYGASRDYHHPEALNQPWTCPDLSAADFQGQEAVGALRFSSLSVPAEGQRSLLIICGTTDKRDEVKNILARYQDSQAWSAFFQEHQNYWLDKVSSIEYGFGDEQYNKWLQWVNVQPVLRRIFGCSFLPDHDYGKGGKGWRDIWQDLLSLILIEPETVRETLVNNFAGVRIDGSNATIIGSQPGEFIADRNAITRVWMDHGVWPLMTMILYIHQSGDFQILLDKNTYFKDQQLSRTLRKDHEWQPTAARQLCDQSGQAYQGTILEHLLIQVLVHFYNVGEHNCCRLESADWNDGLDMAFDRGESVAFSNAYAGNLRDLAMLLEELKSRLQIDTIKVLKEVALLLGHEDIYDQADEKRHLLLQTYFPAVQPQVDGQQVEIAIEDVINDLHSKADWMTHHLRSTQKVSIKEGQETYEWFNGYYDNQGQVVEGQKDDHVRMTLTGQVFAVMANIASEEEVVDVIRSVNRFLKDPKLGCVRLNSCFHIPHYLDLGRAFGFAFGSKENGAFFSHMIVMYAYALYHRGFSQDGHAVLSALYRLSATSGLSHIYPGIPEYFDNKGKGMYHFLTGSASWLVLTQLTQVLGVRGQYGDLLLQPKLEADQFDATGRAGVVTHFAGKKVEICYQNPAGLGYNQYAPAHVNINDQPADDLINQEGVLIPKAKFLETKKALLKIEVELKHLD